MKTKHIALFITLSLFVSACGGRLPAPARTQKILKHFFIKYSKKYPGTIYGQHGIAKVQIENQSEIRKKFVAVESYVTLGDGSLKKIHATVEKGPFGWRFVSWEDATGL